MKKDFLTRKTLLMRAQNESDNIAWEDFTFYYADFISIVLRKFLLNEEDKADLQQEILLSLWKNLKKYDPEKAKFRTWLSSIIKNAAINRINKHKLKHKLNNPEVKEYLMPDKDSELELEIQKEWEAYVSTLAFERIKHLFSEKALKSFTLFLDKMSPEQIAKQLEISRDSVYKMRARVVKRLQDEIKIIRLDTEF
jgi:RNA polymerase sigma factor (sigma-70 family)